MFILYCFSSQDFYIFLTERQAQLDPHSPPDWHSSGFMLRQFFSNLNVVTIHKENIQNKMFTAIVNLFQMGIASVNVNPLLG